MLQGRAALLLILIGIMIAAGCGVPNLEKPECTEARDAARRFYSFHFGNDMHPSADSIKLRERFLTPDYLRRLTAENSGITDPFTLSDDPPKTFKIGVCRQNDEGSIEMQIQLYWKDENSTVQREVIASMARSGGQWLLNNVSKAR